MGKAVEIKLTPELLKTQGEKLGAISDSYRTTLKQVDRVLKRVNTNWSYRLANNFGTKIHSVAKSSETLVMLLEQSSAAAINAGESFSSIDSQLAKFIGGNAANSNESSIKTVPTQKNPSAPKINSIADLLNYLDNIYDKNLTEEQQKLLEATLKEVFGEDFVDVIKILKRIAQGKFDWKTGIDTLSFVFGLFAESNIYLNAVWTTLKTIPKYIELGEKYERELFENLEKGNIVILKIPENVKYIRLSTDSGHLDNIKVYPIVNKEVTNYTNQNIKIEDSILNSENIIDDYYIEEDGKDVSYKGWSETDYFDLSKYKSLLVIGNDNIYNAIYDKDKQFIKTVNFSGTILYNSKIGDVGTDIAYIKVTDAFKYMRLSNGTSILKSVKMYPISNEDFNKHLIFNVGK